MQRFYLICAYLNIDWILFGVELSGPSNPGPATSVSEGVSDYWSIGVILYEIFTGADFATVFPTGIQTHTPIVFPHSRQEYRKSGHLLNKYFAFCTKSQRYKDSCQVPRRARRSQDNDKTTDKNLSW